MIAAISGGYLAVMLIAALVASIFPGVAMWMTLRQHSDADYADTLEAQLRELKTEAKNATEALAATKNQLLDCRDENYRLLRRLARLENGS